MVYGIIWCELTMLTFNQSKARAVLVALALGASAWPLANAQDGAIRQRLKERFFEKQQGGVSITQPGDYRFSLQHDGLTRLYRVHVPASYRPDHAAPLLVALHGGGGNMDLQADDSHYGLISKSEREGFVAVFPNGRSKFAGGKLATWNAGNCCGEARDAQVDDVGFIRLMLEQLMQQLTIDHQRIYATGMSNGAMMAYRLACEMSDVFKAIAAVAGTDNTRQCRPQRPVSVLHIHAKNDTHVLFEGGVGPDSVKTTAVTDYVSVAQSTAAWVQRNGCPVTPKRVLNKTGAYCELYSPCHGRTAVQLCVTDTGGHSWPGGQKVRGTEPPSQAISANDVMWKFFSRQTP